MSSVSADVLAAVATRLQTIVVVPNGYPDPFKAVYFDKIPMGLELTPEQLPTAFLLQDGAPYQHQHSVMNVSRNIRVQVVHKDEATDTEMSILLNNVARAIYANSPTIEREGEFRSIHPKITWIELDSDDTDLHMIDGNRIAGLRLIVHYRCRPYEI